MDDEKQYLVVTSRLPPMSYEEAKAYAARLALREGNGLAHVVKVVATVEYSPAWKESK
jgi:hypothetical protein